MSMFTRDSKFVRKGKEIREMKDGASNSEKYKRLAGQIKRVIDDSPKIESSEVKQAIDDLEKILCKENNERFLQMKLSLEAIYEPRKQYKILPVDRLNKPFLNALGDEDLSDPESVKILRAKSLKVNEMLLEKNKINLSKDKLYNAGRR